MPELRVGLVGCGWMSKWLLQAWRQIEDVQVTAICDIDYSVAERRGEEFGVSRIYDNFDKMLDNENLHIIDIATGVASHKSLVCSAAARGKHILCQKPMAPTPSEAEEMVEACEQYGVKFMIHQNFRWQPWFVKIKELLDQGIIGTPFLANITQRICCTLPTNGKGQVPLLEGQPGYAKTQKLLLMEMGSHYVDLYRHLFGEPCTVYAQIKNCSPYVAGDDVYVLILSSDSMVGIVDDSWCAIGWDTTNRTEIMGERGSILFPGTAGPLSRCNKAPALELRCADGTAQQCVFKDGNYFLESCIKAQRHFVECIEEGRTPITSGRDNLRSYAIIEKAYESARKGAVVSLKPCYALVN